MATVFIAGSISIQNLDGLIQDRIRNVLDSNHNIVVGDADGADASIQQCLFQYGATEVIVYCSGQAPRNNIANWPVEKVQTDKRPGTRAFFTEKDKKMAKDSDFGLMIWDCESSGTLSNVIELASHGKKSVVYMPHAQTFYTVSGPDGLYTLLGAMTDRARSAAERKINIQKRIAELKDMQFDLSI